MKSRSALALSILAVVSSAHAQDFNSLRLAHLQLGPTTTQVPTGFLIRAKAAGYTHILCEYLIHPANEWSNGFYVGASGTFSFRDGLRDAFQAASAYGMQLIPLFQVANEYSGHWSNTNNAGIDWESRPDGSTSTMPALAYDANGFDRSFTELITVIRDAYTASGIGGSLGYVHLGHDEARDAAGNLLIGRSGIDSIWMAANPPPSGSTSIQNLYANSIARRVQDVKSILPNTQVMIWGDMLDPQHNGGQFNTANTIALPAMQSSSVRDNLIIIPWSYHRCFASETPPPCPSGTILYNSQTAFTHFKSNSYRFLFASNEEGNIPTRILMTDDYLRTANMPDYRNQVKGFVSTNWGVSWNNGNDAYQQDYSFKLLEKLSHVHYLNVGSP